ncbi:uncharacterized protein O3C94_004946 [Discoglossus pictus]
MNCGWRKLLPEAVAPVNLKAEPIRIVEDMVSLGKSMGLEVTNEDIDELVEEHIEELSTKEPQDLQREGVADELSSSGEEEEREAVLDAVLTLGKMVSNWGTITIFNVLFDGKSVQIHPQIMALLITFALLWIASCGAQNIIEECDEILGWPCKNYQYENVALRGRAAQSTVYGNTAYGYVSDPIHAIDGNDDSNYYHGSCTHTLYDYAPWWRLDLLRPYKIARVTITNRGDCCGERLNGADILIGSSLANKGNNNPRCARINHIPAGATQTFQCNNMVGRYVNIVIPGKKEWLHFCEVQVFAIPTFQDILQ